MEEGIFRRPAVAGALQEFVEARLHSDHRDEAIKTANVELQLRLANSYANPIFVTVNPETGVKLAIQEGASSEAKFAAFLRSSLDSRDKQGPVELELAGAPAEAQSGSR